MEESDLKYQHLSNNLVEMINLKYSKFLAMVKELNSIAEYFLDDEGYRTEFHLVKGTDSTFLWKLTVRIECLKIKNDDSNETLVKKKRLLRLNQFYNIYNHIKQQSEALKIFQNSSLGNVDSTSATSTNSAKCSAMTESKLFDTIQSMSFHETDLKDDEICCICMESRSNMILSCTHNYCEQCIEEWHVTSNTCPICRAKHGENDGFLLADKPDYYVLQEDLSRSIFQITEPPIKSSPTNNNAYESSTNSDSD